MLIYRDAKSGGIEMQHQERNLVLATATAVVLFSGCATITNDPNIPISVSFSDGSAGECTFRNKRGT